jgi:hypothetical protein
MRGAHQEIVLIREALEGFIAPEVATAIIFDALAQTPTPPRSLHEARSFVAGPLTDVVSRRVRADEVTSIIRLMQDVIDSAIDRDGLDVDVEIDSLTSASGESSTETQQMSTIAPDSVVPVLWAGETPWGERLVNLSLRMTGSRAAALVTLDRREGIEPLCDLVLSRFRGV